MLRNGWATSEKANECSYKEKEDQKNSLGNGINNNGMVTAIIRKLTAMRKTNEITSEQVLCGARKVEVQTTQKLILDAIKEHKEV